MIIWSSYLFRISLKYFAISFVADSIIMS